jgi:hypothetical protein
VKEKGEKLKQQERAKYMEEAVREINGIRRRKRDSDNSSPSKFQM